MTHRVRGAFGRVLASSLAFAVALLVAAASLAAQGTTGKIEGTVTDPQGAPIANAQVTIVGTSFGALTSEKGYYFINNVPVGTYTLRARFIGYTPAEVPGVRVSGGQTITANIKLTPSAVAIGPVTVEAAANPIVPRDQVTSKSIISGDLIDRLPINDVREVLRLEPGVVESGSAKGVSIRGGRPGEAAFYIDGVLARQGQGGEARFSPTLSVGTNAIEEASVTTGALGAEFGEAQSGIIALVTRAGGQKYSGSLSYQTDDVGGIWKNVGLNRVEASIGGPVRGNLTFFVAGTLSGQKSAETQLDRDIDRPVYVMSGVDTIVRQPTTVGDPLADTTDVAIPRFVQYSGYCSPSSNTSSLKAKVAGNYNVECQGLRLPYTANSSLTGNAKLQYTYGSGSRVSLGGLVSVDQDRNFPIDPALERFDLYNANNREGTRLTSWAGIANWVQNLSRSAERAMALDVNLSYQLDNVIRGPLTRQSELDSRDPFGGFLVSPMDFIVDFNTTHDVTIAGTTHRGVKFLDDIQVACLQAGQAACRDDSPFLERDDLLGTQPFRMSPYAVEQSARLPLWTTGLDNPVFLSHERRLQARANFDWQVDRYNRLKLGGEFHNFDTRRYNSGMVSPFGINAYHEKPIRYGAYIEDRLDLGDVVLVGGLRYDRFDSRAKFPYTAARISSIIVDTLISGSDTVAFQPFDPLNPEANFLRAPAHDAWSPRLQVSFPVTERTNFRLSYAHQVQAPDFDLMFRGKNTDLTLTNRNQTFGRDLDFGKTIIFEFGVRHAFSQDMVLDVSAYNKDKVADVAGRLFRLPDPGEGGSVRDFRLFTNADFGNVRGVDFRLDRRFSNLFSGSLSYTFQVATSTGSDPFSYFRTLARVISTLTGETAPPPQALLPTDDTRSHNIAGSAALTFSDDWRKGTALGTVLRNVGAFATFRFASGLPFTLIRNSGEGVAAGEAPLEFTNLEPINSSRMPWFKNVDLRVTKAFRVGRVDWTLFAESKNLFNFRNVVSVFIETGDVVNAEHRARFVDEQILQLETEATTDGLLKVDAASGENYVDFTAPGVCTGWSARSGQGGGGPVDCVLLTRAEARFGDGDGRFLESEYRAAFDAWYNLGHAPSRFYGAGRRLRIGAELSF